MTETLAAVAPRRQLRGTALPHGGRRPGGPEWHDGTVPDQPDPAPQRPAEAPEPGRAAVFRVSGLTIMFAVVFAVCAIPFAFGAPWFWLVYLVPLGVVVTVVRVRTTVDDRAVTVRRLLRTRRVPWDAISSLRLRPRHRMLGSRVSAVLTDGGELPLPAVHVRDLPQLAAVSGGRLPDPAGE
jgi:hypothetical protein